MKVDWVPIKAVAELSNDVLNESTSPDYTFEYIDIGNVTSDGRIAKTDTMTFAQAPSRARRRVKRGDVIVSTVRTYLKAIAPIEDERSDLVASTGLAVLRPRPAQVDPRFLAYAIRSAPVVASIVANAEGVSYPAIAPAKLERLPLPVPSRQEQRAIVRFLDEETATIDSLLEKNHRVRLLMEERKRAQVSSIIDSNPGADFLPLKRVAPFVTSGSRGWAAYYSREGANFIRIGNLESGSIDLNLKDVQKVDPPVNAEAARTMAQSGDVLISITAQIGSVGVVPSGFAGYVNQHVALCRPSLDLIEPRWLAYCLFSNVGQRQFGRELYGGTKQGLGLDDVKAIRVPLPSLDRQRQMLNQLDRTMSDGVWMIHCVQEAGGLLHEYRSALVTAAVTGNLDVGNAA